MMTFEEAVRDSRRPLSLTPREWMYSVEASLAEEEQLVDKTMKRLSAKKDDVSETERKDSGTGMEKIDMGLDQMVEGVKLMARGLLEAKMADMRPGMRKVVDEIGELLETAIEPYLVDMVKLSDSLDGAE